MKNSREPGRRSHTEGRGNVDSPLRTRLKDRAIERQSQKPNSNTNIRKEGAVRPSVLALQKENRLRAKEGLSPLKIQNMGLDYKNIRDTLFSTKENSNPSLIKENIRSLNKEILKTESQIDELIGQLEELQDIQEELMQDPLTQALLEEVRMSEKKKKEGEEEEADKESKKGKENLDNFGNKKAKPFKKEASDGSEVGNIDHTDSTELDDPNPDPVNDETPELG